MRLPPRKYIERTMKKSHEIHDNEIHVLRYIPRPSNIYGETLGKAYKDPIKLFTYLEMNPTELKLQDMGWEKEDIGVILRVPFATLLDRGLANRDGTLNFSLDDKLYIPHIDREFHIALSQGRAPFREGVPTFVWIAGRKNV